MKKKHVSAEGVSVEEGVTGAVESLPSDQPQPLLKSSIAVPATADDRFEDATMDHEASVEEHAGGSVQTVSCHEVAGVDSTPAEDTTDQLSASHLDFGEESSYPKGAPQTAASSNVSQEQCGEKEAHPRTATVGGVPGELRGEEGVCSSSAEPERTGTKPEIDRKLRLDLPQDTSLESGSAVPGEFIIRTRATSMSGLRCICILFKNIDIALAYVISWQSIVSLSQLARI